MTESGVNILGDSKALVTEIERLKKEKHVLILAHYYTRGEVQEIADVVGDSFQLAKMAQESTNKIICFCGVSFMGESAKILNPDKKVLIPAPSAGCPMADMVDYDQIAGLKEKYEDLAIVSYINTNADVKRLADVCVTSSNAMKIVSNLPNENIYFMPDMNLGSYIKNQVKGKNFILHEGYCKYHHHVDIKEVKDLKEKYGYDVLAHPECRESVVEEADIVGSTKALLEYVAATKKKGYIVCTESGILHQMKKVSPESEFIIPSSMNDCRDMKKIDLESLYLTLRDETGEVILDEGLIKDAKAPLIKMMEMS